LPHFHDVLLLRIHAQLLLALQDANSAVAVLGTAVRRLAAARRGMEQRPSLAGSVAVELLQEQEAQVRRPVGLLMRSGLLWACSMWLCIHAAAVVHHCFGCLPHTDCSVPAHT
jgi:hypothetical protein